MRGLFCDWRRKQVFNYLKNTDSRKILKQSSKMLIPAFLATAKKVPAYKKILQNKNLDILRVKDIKSFQELVPVINKEIFSLYRISELCRDGDLGKAKIISTSSGFSGKFSFSLSTEKELKGISRMTDFLMEYTFDSVRKKTLLINCLGMGVKVYTGLTLAETSVRPDSVLAIIDKFAGDFQQFILIGNPFFLKKVLEDGVKIGIDWKSKQVNLVIGEDWFPESFRSYLAGILGVDFDSWQKGLIGSNMGVCELGLSLFQESPATINIRRLSEKDKRLKEALFGKELTTCPILFHYNPFQIFLEELNGELLFSVLDKDALIPLLRYDSGDRGRIIPYQKLKEVLSDFHYQSYLPRIQLPLVAVSGRKDKLIRIKNTVIYPEEVKEGIYSDFEIASATTGYFRMTEDSGALKLEVQLREGVAPGEELHQRFKQAIVKFVKADLSLILYPYREFPSGIDLVYEQKFKYI
jgi:phenylacetate-CoA ligase